MVSGVEHILDGPFTGVVLVDDHAFVRDMLSRLFVRSELFEVVGTANTADAALDLVKQAGPNAIDVVVMDIDMPGTDCFKVAQRIMTGPSGARILFLSAHVQDRYIDQALKIGARAYVTKRDSAEALKAAVRAVAAGGSYFSDEVAERLVVDRDQGLDGPIAEAARTKLSLLTKRELQVLRLIARGLAKRTIASDLEISRKTVDKHCENLMTKLDIHDRVNLARYAIREGSRRFNRNGFIVSGTRRSKSSGSTSTGNRGPRRDGPARRDSHRAYASRGAGSPGLSSSSVAFRVPPRRHRHRCGVGRRRAR